MAMRMTVVIMTTIARPRVTLRTRTASSSLTVIHTLKETAIRIIHTARTTTGISVHSKTDVIAMIMVFIKAEFGLNGRRVNAISVEAFSSGLGEFHVAFAAASFGEGEGDLDVHGCDDLRVRELPDVYVVTRDNAGDVLDIFFDIVHIDVIWRGLQEDLGCGFSERDGGSKNNERDEEGDSGVSIESARVVS